MKQLLGAVQKTLKMKMKECRERLSSAVQPCQLDSGVLTGELQLPDASEKEEK